MAATHDDMHALTKTLPNDTQRALQLMKQFDDRMSRGIQLYAGSCLLSPMVQYALNNTMGLMPAMGDAHQKQQPGTDEISELELLVNRQLMDLFGSAWADARLQSCTYANAALYATFSQPGDAIASIAAEDGGHISHHMNGTVGVLGRRNVALLYRDGKYDDEGSAAVIERERPRIVMLGASVVLDPFEVINTVAAARSIGALLAYDASHVAGLIAGGMFQNPFDLGFDIMTASTYKTLCGPPGGILVGRELQHAARLRAHIVGGWTSNYDASRLAALSVALSEAKEFMPAYAKKMIENAQTLSQLLSDSGLETMVSGNPHSKVARSHQVVVPFDSNHGAASAAKAAERAGIYVGTARVPGRPDCAGLRIGTQVITRQGITRDDMKDLSESLCIIVSGNPHADIPRRVSDLASRLDACLYSFDALYS